MSRQRVSSNGGGIRPIKLPGMLAKCVFIFSLLCILDTVLCIAECLQQVSAAAANNHTGCIQSNCAAC